MSHGFCPFAVGAPIDDPGGKSGGDPIDDSGDDLGDDPGNNSGGDNAAAGRWNSRQPFSANADGAQAKE